MIDQIFRSKRLCKKSLQFEIFGNFTIFITVFIYDMLFIVIITNKYSYFLFSINIALLEKIIYL